MLQNLPPIMLSGICFRTYYSQNYAHSSYYSPNHANIQYLHIKFMHVNPTFEL